MTAYKLRSGLMYALLILATCVSLISVVWVGDLFDKVTLLQSSALAKTCVAMLIATLLVVMTAFFLIAVAIFPVFLGELGSQKELACSRVTESNPWFLFISQVRCRDYPELRIWVVGKPRPDVGDEIEFVIHWQGAEIATVHLLRIL